MIRKTKRKDSIELKKQHDYKDSINFTTDSKNITTVNSI